MKNNKYSSEIKIKVVRETKIIMIKIFRKLHT